ncbi:MAG: hypothetical protein KJO08_08925 [Gammaproteobacteria bacterium]|nr:hypothetical protein [Gammaproteobacteria bacterium]NNJ84915.1 hypothetical protein [Gammaproteobacteria bacterium]
MNEYNAKEIEEIKVEAKALEELHLDSWHYSTLCARISPDHAFLWCTVRANSVYNLLMVRDKIGNRPTGCSSGEQLDFVDIWQKIFVYQPVTERSFAESPCVSSDYAIFEVKCQHSHSQPDF